MAEEKAPQPGYVVGAVTTRLTVTVPHGIAGGELVRVAAPDGSYHSIMVPAGLMAGQQFSVELLAGSNAVDYAKLKVRQKCTGPSLHPPPPPPRTHPTAPKNFARRWSWRQSAPCDEKHSRRRFAVERCAALPAQATAEGTA
eukprot:4323127-Prymnesium_polylepis.1